MLSKESELFECMLYQKIVDATVQPPITRPPGRPGCANGYHVPTFPNSFFKNLRNAAARSRRVRGVRARHRRTRCL